MIRIRLLLAALGAVFAIAAHADDLDAMIEDCNGCHGDDGVSQWDDVPTIAGIPQFNHADALYIYRDGDRPCADAPYRQGDTSRPETNMCDVVADFDDDMIEDIADYYAELEWVAAAQEFDADLAAAGEAIHNADCRRCHADGGSDPEDEASILAGQWMGYMRTTFAEYRSGDRDQPDKMREVMDPLSEEDEEALIHFYASQQ